ncbi:apolipoprotein A-IV [Pleuronectes platessa]|uniref:apolipoprotein A-IV n=1 Tax=Pleuronectes platessa TaxID=8262 RepID=UPI00232A5253|nr:apolipoprotein A-IV [Pleuronectes platessa]XP_053302831.1 apolipoprotein A-IV [Pleuronectes platessa]
MKVLVVLALALFSVCNADVQSQEAPKINLERVKGAFLDRIGEAVLTAATWEKEFRQSELGQDVHARITQSTDSVKQYFTALLSEDVMIQLTQEAEKLQVCLTEGLTTVGSSLQPIAEDLAAKLQTQVEALLPETQSLQQQLTQKTQEIRERLMPYGDGMKDKLYDGFNFPRHTASKASTHQLFLPSLLIVYLIK